jgi:glycosyltransferase involved in cell wall biosynthesis
MHIFSFTSSHRIGLTSLLTEQALSFSRNEKHRFSFVSSEREQYPGLFDTLRRNNIRYFVINGMDEHRHFLRLVNDFKRLLETDPPDYVTVNTNWQLAIAVAAKVLSEGTFKIVYVVHGYRHNYRFRSFIARYVIMAALFFFADHVVTPSSFVRKKFGLLGRKNRVIFLGGSESLFVDHPPPLFSGTKRLIFPGEFRKGKNQDMLIRVLKRYVEKTGDNDIELYLPGRGERLEWCKSLCRRLGIDDKVFFPEFIDQKEMLDLYLKCQYALIPSSVETFGLCITEPFILGRVIITRHVGVADDIILDGESGFFFNGEEELLTLLLKILPDQALCSRVAANARGGRDQFRWENIGRRYIDLIFEALAKR